MDIKEKVKNVPDSPGVYIMKGQRGRVLYVGKAKSLRKRLSSYFTPASPLDPRKSKMVREVIDIDYVVTENELEALVLEANFIKRMKPRYNIILRDDKNYPYIKLTVNEEWPRLEVVRKIKKDGALYFGPYVPAGAMWEMLRFIRKTFPIRTCRYNLDRPFRPCVLYQMGMCLAPCSESFRDEESKTRYSEVVEEVRAFLRGERKDLIESLKEKMHRCSQELRFEEAAKIRDRIKALERAWESQRVISPEIGDLDVIGLYRDNDRACIFVFFIRSGMIIGQRDFIFKKGVDPDPAELIRGFIEQFYSREILIPPRIIIPVRADLKTQEAWLSSRRGDGVSISPPMNDIEEKVLSMAEENALFALGRHLEKRIEDDLIRIKDMLNLKSIPQRIVAVDVSNLSGAEAVGAIIVYEDGEFRKSDYRLFKIKTVEGIDDYAMISEVVGRYLDDLQDDQLPDLMIIDGGRAHLESALKVVKEYDLNLDVVAMAKIRDGISEEKKIGINTQYERIYIPHRPEPVYLEPSASHTHLLQKIRDEVHRFAITYHKKLRKKRTLTSPLEGIKGIGRVRRLALLRHFGSIEKIKRASIEEIASVEGMNRKVAEAVKNALK